MGLAVAFKRLAAVSLLFGPFVLATNLVLLLRREVILDVERFANFLGRFALDHIGDRFASNVEESLYVKIIGSLDADKPLLLVLG